MAVLISSQWLDQLDYQSSFIWRSISRIIGIQITDPFFQINSPNKCQTHRKKVLSLTLSFPYLGHYITMPNLERF